MNREATAATSADIWDLFKRTRIRKGMTQEELADCMGFDQTYISYIERGMLKNPPNPEVVTKFCDCLGISRNAVLRQMGWLDASPPRHLDNAGIFFQLDSLTDELKIPDQLKQLIHNTIATAQQLSESADDEDSPA